MDAALAFLSYRPRTRREIQLKLAGRGFDETTIEAALSRLEEVGLVNDLVFIETYVRERIANRPMGVRRMAQELYTKGIPRKQTLPVLERVLGEEKVEERALAERAADKKVASLRGHTDRRAARRRLSGYLARRGFDREVIREVVEARLPGP